MPHEAWPVDPGAIAPFLAAVVLIELTPGPNMGYLAGLSAVEGRRAGLVTVAGITCGLLVYMLASVAGVTQVLGAHRPLYELLRWAGVAYIAWLALDAWRGGERAETAPGRVTDWTLFRKGLLANLLNPKAALFYVTLLPGFVQPGHASPTTQALILGGIHILVSVAVHGGIVLSSDGLARRIAALGDGVRARRIFAVALLATAVWIAFETRLRG
ncbi:LysE family translocator [Caulobacter sp. RL271]|jgi:threonine/homoserine/homoserine lactone efflux protein|uniref:LysE family translocator n=1 Tax=Caulobacter segnis TaxID=88688 RepID=A0ABY4ZZI8_9CAUL|nr:LysE family translocator [Caulobacter segnis]USQ97764.1 LysE family translocator [Caulobacter segnis]